MLWTIGGGIMDAVMGEGLRQRGRSWREEGRVVEGERVRESHEVVLGMLSEGGLRWR